MNKRFWGTENLATLSLYIYYAAFMVIFIINQFISERGIKWLELAIASVVLTALSLFYLMALKNQTSEEDELYGGPKKLDKFLLVLLILTLLMEGFIFILYAVMFIMTWNQVPPYPHKWTEIAMFLVTLVSLVMGVTALIKNMVTPKYLDGKCQ